jgi:hypothetical protein
MMSERGRAPNRAHERVDATGLSRAYGQEGRGAGESVCWLSESRRQIGSRLAQGRLKVGSRLGMGRSCATGQFRPVPDRGPVRVRRGAGNEKRAIMRHDPDNEKDRCANTGLLHGSSIVGALDIGFRSDRRQTA